MAKLKSGTRIYGTATIDTSLVVGSAVTATSSGIQVAGIVTATQLVSTVATSTAPLTVSSTTVVPNLNVSFLQGYQTATANTINSIVLRDGSGNFSAGTITASLTGAASLNVLKAGDTMTGQLISTLANNTATGGGQIYLNGANGNRIDFQGGAGSGLALPAFNVRSVGTKIVLYPEIGSTTSDYALGISGGVFWSSVSSSSAQFSWYAGTTSIATLSGVGQLNLNSNSSANNSVLYLSGTPTSSSGTNGLFGIGALSFSDTDIIADFTHSVNSYAQLIVQNKNSGSSSSADIIVNNDRSAGTTYYGDFGINGTTFAGGGVFGDVDGTYLYSAGGTLSLGSLNAHNVKIATNNTERVRVFSTGEVGIGTTVLTGTASQLLQVTGGAYVSGSLGIGTTNPTTKLVVTQTSANSCARFETGASTGVNIRFSDSTTTNQVGVGAIGNDFVVTMATGGERLRVTTGGNVGIGTTNPTQPLQVQGNARVTGAVYDSTNSPGTSGQVLQSTVSGTQWTTAAAGGGGSGKFDTTIDNVLYVQPTGTLDIVGVGTTVTQITTLPSGSNKYLIHSLHVTNISNGDAEITAGFVMNARKVPASITVGGGAGINTITVGSGSSIIVGMAVTGQGNIGETTGIGSTAGFQFNTYVTSVDGNNITLSKPIAGLSVSGTAWFSPVSKVSSRLPVPVGSAVELLKQPMVLNALDSIVLQSTGAGSGIGSTSTAAITQAANSNILTVTAGAAITNFLASGMLIQPTGNNTGIQTNTFVGVGYTPGALTIPMTRPTTVALASTSLSFTEVVVPQDGALQVTVVYQSSTDTSYLNGTGTVSAAGTITSIPAGISSIPIAYYATGNTYPSIIQSIRVSNISDGIIYPGGDYPVSVGIGNSDTIFSWLAYNMVIPKNSSIELCESPKRIGIGQSIFAFSNTPYAIEIQVAGKQKTT